MNRRAGRHTFYTKPWGMRPMVPAHADVWNRPKKLDVAAGVGVVVLSIAGGQGLFHSTDLGSRSPI